jgi:hypothetical protein
MNAENASMPKPGAAAASSRPTITFHPAGGGRIGRQRTASHIGATAINPNTIDNRAPFGRVRPHTKPHSAARHNWFLWK